MTVAPVSLAGGEQRGLGHLEDQGGGRGPLELAGGGHLIDLIELPADALLGRSPSAALGRRRGRRPTASVLVLATPIYRATDNGTMKAFLDRFGSNGLDRDGRLRSCHDRRLGRVIYLALEVHLRPVLVELGATVPARGLYVTEPELAAVDAAIARWPPPRSSSGARCAHEASTHTPPTLPPARLAVVVLGEAQPPGPEGRTLELTDLGARAAWAAAAAGRRYPAGRAWARYGDHAGRCQGHRRTASA